MTPPPARKIRQDVENQARRERERLQADEAERIAAAHAQLQREREERYQARYLAATAAAAAEAASDEEWDFRVVDADLIPRAYLLGPDEEAIRRVVRREKDKTQIPGVEVYVRVATAVRRA